jgi:hypothetical protein
VRLLTSKDCHFALLARQVCSEEQSNTNNDIFSMWGQISSAAGQLKRTINAVASEIKDAVEEVCL